MQLLIDTTEKNKLSLALIDQERVLAKKKVKVEKQSEKILPELKRFLKKSQVELSDLKKITVKPGPGPFSAVRTGVAVANSLAFALGIPVSQYPSKKEQLLVLPRYDKEPNIT